MSALSNAYVDSETINMTIFRIRIHIRFRITVYEYNTVYCIVYSLHNTLTFINLSHVNYNYRTPLYHSENLTLLLHTKYPLRNRCETVRFFLWQNQEQLEFCHSAARTKKEKVEIQFAIFFRVFE